MRRRLLLLNLALLALAGLAGWRLRALWQEGRVEERRVLRPAPKPVTPPPPASMGAPQPASAAAYSVVASKMLFSTDRNPTVVVEAAPVKPVPAFPVAYGMMNLGGGPLVILSEKAGAPNRGYSAGEKVGDFKLASVEGDELVFEFDGRTFRKRLQDLKPRGDTPATETRTAATTAPAAPAATVSAPAATGPGFQINSELRACTPGDSTPAGTVRDGYRKIVSSTPFGQACRWEQAR